MVVSRQQILSQSRKFSLKISFYNVSLIILILILQCISLSWSIKQHELNIREDESVEISQDGSLRRLHLTNRITRDLNRAQNFKASSLLAIPIADTESISKSPVSSGSSSNLDEDIIEDGLCTLTTLFRKSLASSNNWNSNKQANDVRERALLCSNVDEKNYSRMVRSFFKRSMHDIQQITITQSEPLVVFSAVDLICGRFNCSRLTVFNVTGQKIHDFNVLSGWIGHWTELEVLDLSNTSLSSIESIFPSGESTQNSATTASIDLLSSYTLRNLTTLQLDNNNITSLDFNFVLKRMPNLRYLSLINNTLVDIHCNESLRSRVRTQFESIGLAGNSISCDKSQLWLIKQLQNPIMNRKFPDYEQIKCGTPDGLADMNWAQRVSVLETPICDQCECRSSKRTAIAIDCHNKNLTALPDILPMNTKILNLTSNRINSLSVPHNSKNWENVTYLHLENNLITNFQTLEINSKFMRNLASLDIRRNKFQIFPSHIFQQFINLDQVHLSNNPWLCDCETTFAFQEWLQRQFQKVGDKEEIICGIFGHDENGVRSSAIEQRLATKVIYRLSMDELCPQENLEEPYDWLDVINITLGVLIGLVVLKVTMDYIYQYRTKRLPHFFRLNI